jgi:hypothetical protein
MVASYDPGTRVASVIPSPVLHHFIRDAESPAYGGFAAAGFVWTTLVDPAKRRFLGAGVSDVGILVVSCLPRTGAAECLRPNDVILEWDGQAVDNLGFYTDPDFGRLAFSYLIKGRRRPGDTASVRLIRDRQDTVVELPLSRLRDGDLLIPENVTGERDEYLVTGGLVLRELTGAYLRSQGKDWQRRADARLLHLYGTSRDQAPEPGDRIVILSSVLPDPINIGYQHFRNVVVTHVNGRPVAGLDDVFDAVDRDGGCRTVKIEYSDVEIVLDRDTLREADERISSEYRLPALRYRRPDSGSKPPEAR